MGKKKDKLAAKANKADAAQKEEVKPAIPITPEEEEKGQREDVFSTAAVVFFTRDKTNAVAKVLVSREERKVRASDVGLDQKGKVVQSMALFPMGRREKKDKNDPVETAKREYLEETGDYGGLSQYLDFADFDGGGSGDEGPIVKEDDAMWSGKTNFCLFFKPAKAMTLFCEVPAKAAKRSHRAAIAGKPLVDTADAAAAEGPSAAKKRKTQEVKPSPSYHVGKMDHLDSHWIEASALRAVANSKDRSPPLEAGGPCRMFSLAASVLRQAEAREWLGLETAEKLG